ncbi:MAG: hypothetical protein ACQERT_09550, partial [Thermodesulfobacteriota bacterium]
MNVCLLQRMVLVCFAATCLLIWNPVWAGPGDDNSEGITVLKSLKSEGKLTVRALRAWGQLPEKFMALAFDLRPLGIDLMNADTRTVRELTREADENEQLRPLLDDLQALAVYMAEFGPQEPESGNSGKQSLQGQTEIHIDRINTAEAWQKAQEKDAAERLQAMQQVRLRMPPVQTAPFLEIESLSQTQWDGAVASAQQAVGMLYGDLSPEEQKKFNDSWAPMRGFPTQKCVDYLNDLNPLLGEFLALRTAINRTSGQLEQAMIEAGWAAELDAEPLTRQYLALAARYRNFLYSLQNRMDAVAKDIAELGEPPDAQALRQQAQHGYQSSKEYVRSLGRVETGPEGIWVGYLKFEQGVPGLKSVKKEPILFVIYNTAPSEETPRFRAINLENDDEASTAWVDALPLQKFRLLDLVNQDTIEGELGDDRSWSPYAQRQVGAELPIFHGAELDLYEQEAGKKLAALAEQEKHIDDLKEGIKHMVSVTMTKSTLEDTRFHYRMRPYFLQAARQFLTDKDWGGSVQNDLHTIQSLVQKYSGQMPPPPEDDAGDEERTQEAKAKGKDKSEEKPATPEAPAPGTPASLHLVDDKTADERRELDQEAVSFHERNIQSIRSNLENDREELAEEDDPVRRHALEQRILHGESDIQSERDRIATLKTGTLVHSRSPFDDYAKSRFIQNIARDQRKMETITKATENAYKLAERLPEDKARQIRAAADKHLGPELMASLDAEKASEVVNTLSSVAQSHWEAERYKAGADAAWADAGLQTALSVKNRADQAMGYASMAGGQSVYMAYQGATGYIEGGPKEAVLRVAESYNKVTGTVSSAYRGYEEDGFKEAFLRVAGSYNDATGWAEDFYRGYEASDGDLLEAMGGATWKMTKAMAINKGTQFATNRISQRFATAPQRKPSSGKKLASGKTGKRTTQALGRAKRKPSDPNADFNRPLTDNEIKTFRTQVADGRTRVTSYKKTFAKLQKARKAKAPPKEIKKLLRELDDRSAKIHSSPQAKIMMKNLQSQPKNKEMVKRYCNSMDRVHTRVEKRFRTSMAQKGWKTQNMVPIRNKDSGKSVNMDYDIALKEEPWFDGNGKPNPWLTKNGKNAPVVAWQAEAQQEWNAAYGAE